MNAHVYGLKEGSDMKGNALVIVDPQNDFCDQRGSLYVDGAAADIVRLSKYIKEMGREIGGIFISLDSHDSVAIFHPGFWTDEAGAHPAGYTTITPDDFRSKKWKVMSAESEPFAERTFAVMERKGIENLMVWPEHCVVSTWGHQIADPLRDALRGWREETGRAVRYVFKGENPYTDQFSIFEGVDDSYPETAFNERLFSQLVQFESVSFAGEALSHCVQESIPPYLRKLGEAKQTVRLFVDCTSPVSGFDREASLAVLGEMGVTFATTAD